jgi:DNA-binding NarL/FixJ family response regulator
MACHGVNKKYEPDLSDQPTMGVRMNVRALIIDDVPLYRQALSAMMSGVATDIRIDAVARAEDALAMLAEEARTCADATPVASCVLLEYALPGMRGAEAIRALREAWPAAALLVCSATADVHSARAALAAGAQAFVSKSVSIEMLSNLVRRALAGDLNHPLWLSELGEQSIDTSQRIELTVRQLDVLALLVEGHSNKRIGQLLGVAEITVKMHVSSIFRTLGAINRTQAAMLAREMGLLSGHSGVIGRRSCLPGPYMARRQLGP